jgi:hypothetical protein
MSIIAVMQPTYFPWMGYFDLIDQADKFIFFDDVKISKQSWGVRNRIKTKQGSLFLTVPLKNYKDHKNRLFLNTEILYDQPWPKKHLKSISQSYAKALYYDEVIQDIKNLLFTQYTTIADLNINIILFICKKIGIETNVIRASEIDGIHGSKDDRLVAICYALNATSYLSAKGSSEYIEAKSPGGSFHKNGIKLYYHNFDHPQYPQMETSFLSHMSIIDLLMNCGYKNSLSVIRSGRRKMIHYDQFRSLYLKSQDLYRGENDF